MTEREKVIKALECCAHVAHMCKECPMDEQRRRYNTGQGCDCWSILADNALTLLAEPRVMTPEELAAAQKTPVWRETKRAHKDLYNGWMLAYDIQRGQGITGTRQGMTEPNGRVGWCKLDDYGRTWRCWTSRPTDEQREAVKWNE